jgi:hypothetical protein
MVFFEEFSIDRILGYLLQLSMTNRWAELTRESGEERFREMITAKVEDAENKYS